MVGLYPTQKELRNRVKGSIEEQLDGEKNGFTDNNDDIPDDELYEPGKIIDSTLLWRSTYIFSF